MTVNSSEDLRILVIGASGLLGQALCVELGEQGIEFVSATHSVDGYLQIDLRNQDSIAHCLDVAEATHVVNCAAYTAVDDAETNYSEAFAINAEGVGSLAIECAKRQLKLVHVSTDYVFGAGLQTTPYSENDRAAPLGIYGLSKWYGEMLINAHLSDALIVRTSWLHGQGGPNFLDTMLRLAQSREEVQVVDDQVGSLTFAPWLAKNIVGLIKVAATGVFHASSVGEISWYEVAQELFKQAKTGTKVIAVSTEQFPRPAPRPRYSALNTDKLRGLLKQPEFTWQESISGHITACRPQESNTELG